MLKKTPEQRFFEKVQIDPETNCWNWIGALNNHKKGIFFFKKKTYLAPQYSFLNFFGHLPKNETVLHKCNNLLCVNPEHLTTKSDPENILLRFWSKVNKDTTSGCWEWISSKCPKTYGTFKNNTKTVKCHRFSYEIHYGEIKNKMHVLHKCDNPSCVNPKHLFLGTNDDNMKDRNQKNRQARLQGSKNGFAKLTESDVLKIREKYIPRKYSVYKLGKEYNVHFSTIFDIIKRNRWTHI